MLPISNPANLVVLGARTPHLSEWLHLFAIPSVASIVLTYVGLRLTQHRALKEQSIRRSVSQPKLSRSGLFTVYGVGITGLLLVGACVLGLQLGALTLVCGTLTTAAVLLLSRRSPWPVLRGISWSVMPLVAGLFVMVEALVRTGAIGNLREVLHLAISQSTANAARSAGIATAIADNIANNLPVGLVAGSVATSDHLPRTGYRRDPDRRRSRAEPVADGLAGNRPVARGIASRQDRDRRLAVPSAWTTGDAAGTDCNLGGCYLVNRECQDAVSDERFTILR